MWSRIQGNADPSDEGEGEWDEDDMAATIKETCSRNKRPINLDSSCQHAGSLTEKSWKELRRLVVCRVLIVVLVVLRPFSSSATPKQ